MNPSKVLVSRQQYRKNLQYLHSLYPNANLMAVLKANAYGHGITLAQDAVKAGCSWIGIVDNWEALDVRNQHLKIQNSDKPVNILRLRPATNEEIVDNLNHDIDMHELVGCIEDADRMNQVAKAIGKELNVHLKVDVGMGRSGFLPALQVEDMTKVASKDYDSLKVRGIMAHFPCADDNLDVTQKQYDLFEKTLEEISSHSNLSRDEIFCHCSNSAATLRLGRAMDILRVGISSYGIAPHNDMKFPRNELKSCMKWTTEIVSVRKVPKGTTVGYGMTYQAPGERVIATLPVGYADGYWRRTAYTNKAQVLIHGKRCPIVGRISMNMITVDVTNLKNVRPGDEVCLMGEQGSEVITPEEVATNADTIGYEVTISAGYTALRRGVHHVVESF